MRAKLATVTPLDTRRPPPPPDLTDEQSEEWRAVVSVMPVDWFGRETYPLLTAYCRHVCRARWLAAKIDSGGDKLIRADGGVQLLDKLLSAAERESRAMLALARSMRITHQAKYDSRVAARAASSPAASASFYDVMPDSWGTEDDDTRRWIGDYT